MSEINEMSDEVFVGEFSIPKDLDARLNKACDVLFELGIGLVDQYEVVDNLEEIPHVKARLVFWDKAKEEYKHL